MSDIATDDLLKSVSSRPSPFSAVIPKPRTDIRIKVLSMGEGNVGKSCVIKRYCEQKFINKYIATIGVDFGVRTLTIDDKEVKVNFWDLSGHPEFFHVRNEFYKNTQAALLVYDVTSKKSFAALEQWLKEAAKFGDGVAPLVTVVCANKIDLVKKRLVSEEEGKKWASEKGFAYFETSAKSGQNINELFAFMFGAVAKKMASSPPAASASASVVVDGSAQTQTQTQLPRSPAAAAAFVSTALADLGQQLQLAEHV